MLPQEYLVLLGSFVAINIVGLELGMLLGLLLAAFNFVLGYARSPAVRTVNRRSLTVGAPAVLVLYSHYTHTLTTGTPTVLILYSTHTLLYSYSALILYCTHILLYSYSTLLILYCTHTLLILILFCTHTLLYPYA
jgi:hypothetical protein